MASMKRPWLGHEAPAIYIYTKLTVPFLPPLCWREIHVQILNIAFRIDDVDGAVLVFSGTDLALGYAPS
jgi:hypothetical protein